ncbi:MAG: hypothetical protein WD425_05415, partial [Nitrospirales bacterium]
SLREFERIMENAFFSKPYIVQWDLILFIDERGTTEFAVQPSPNRCAIFGAGVTSRMNVGGFMADPISDDATWVESL